MSFKKVLCESNKNKNLGQTRQLSKKGNQDQELDKSMVWRSLHHKAILLSEPGRDRRECIYSWTSPHRRRSQKLYSEKCGQDGRVYMINMRTFIIAMIVRFLLA